jgi:ABC-2 type transport system ATP-binding protein
VRQAPVHELTNGSRTLLVKTPEAPRLAAVLREHGLTVREAGDELEVAGADAAHVGTLAFRAQVPLLGLGEQETSLEDAFLELTEEGGAR